MPQHFCPWEISTLYYDGCCSHVAIAEGVAGQKDAGVHVVARQAIARPVVAKEVVRLTAEQLEANDAERKLRISEQRKAVYYGAKHSDFAAWKATRRRYESKRDHDEKLASAKKTAAKAKAERRYACDTCGLAFEATSNLTAHYLTKRHVDKVRGIAPKIAKTPEYATWAQANIAAKKHYCSVCDHVTSTKQKLEIHCTSQRHKKRAAEALESSS